MNKQSAQHVRFARIRQWLAQPFIDEVGRRFFRLGQISMASNNPWNRTRRTEQSQPVPLLPALNESDLQRRIHIAAEKCGPRPRPGEFAFRVWHPEAPAHHTMPPVQLAVETTPAQPSDRFLLNDTNRGALFEDVALASEQPDEDDGYAPTVLTPRAKKQQEFRNAISQLLPSPESEDTPCA